MIVLNRIYTDFSDSMVIDYELPLTAEQRKRSYQKIELENGNIFLLKLPRSTNLKIGDILIGEKSPESEEREQKNQLVKITGQLEKVITVTGESSLQLLQGAYHLGNRHIALEINSEYLRLNYDRVLEEMLIKMGLTTTVEKTIFNPEKGAYHHHH